MQALTLRRPSHRMERTKYFINILFTIFLQLLLFTSIAFTSNVYSENSPTNENEISPQISWVFSKPTGDSLHRIKRNPIHKRENNLLSLMLPKCQINLKELCEDVDKNDELVLLECIQTLKVRIIMNYRILCTFFVFIFLFH